MNAPTIEQAKAACINWARREGVTLIWPGDPIREAVLYAMAAYHGLAKTGWDLASAREGVSVTLPGAGSPTLDLIRKIPYVGGLLALAAQQVERPFICFSPAACSSGVNLMGTMAHEMGHVGSIRAGGIGWCIAYGLAPEARAAGEAPCYGASMNVHHHLEGVDPTAWVAGSVRALGNYGLDELAKALAEGILLSNAASLAAGADPGGVWAEVERELRAVGWTP